MIRRRRTTIVALILALIAGANCRQALGIEEAALVCPDDLPDCTPCNSTEDCGPGGECHAWTCKDMMCTPINTQPGTDCSVGVCSDDQVAECVECNVDADCSPGNRCNTNRICVFP